MVLKPQMIDLENLPYTEHGKIVNSEEFDGLSTEEGKEAIVKKLRRLESWVR